MGNITWVIIIKWVYTIILIQQVCNSNKIHNSPQPTKADKLWSAKYIGSSSKNFKKHAIDCNWSFWKVYSQTDSMAFTTVNWLELSPIDVTLVS